MGSRPGLEIVHPMAVVLLGGLVTSTLLGLFVLPSLYRHFGGTWPKLAAEEALMMGWAGDEPRLAGEPAGTVGERYRAPAGWSRSATA